MMVLSMRSRLAAAILLSLATPLALAAAEPLHFRITFAESVSKAPFTGRVFVFLSKSDGSEPRFGPNWMKPEPFFARDVREWRPGTQIAIDNTALACPMKLADVPKGTYYAQAVMDFDCGSREIGRGPGNAYGKAIKVELDPSAGGSIALQVDQIVPERAFTETDRVKLVDIESKVLSAFHGKPMHLRAGVVLPMSFNDKPDQRYPVIYEIPGFGGNHFMALGMASRNVTDVAGVEMLYVILDPGCRTGHHVFADSANNGPYGKALIEELIPHIEKTYRGLGQPAARFVTGHSSGGWSSLWLQVAYPDFFGGVWSLSPDPVDFHDFQRVNIYQPGVNIFKDEAGKDRPLARRGDQVLLWYKGFSDMEWVLGRGGQLASFEAVFGPKGADGQPKLLWDRTTGAIDPAVAKSWEAYDINLVIKKQWPVLGPKLKGKLHIITGEKDTFYLEGAVRLLKQTLTDLGSDAVVEIQDGHDHGSLLTKALRERVAKEMAESYRRSFPGK